MTKPWQQRAREKEWSESDISTVESMLKLGSDQSDVIRVTAYEITVRSVPAADGMERSHPRYWKWKKREMPEPKMVARTEPIPWCPVHGNRCNPTIEGCGMGQVVVFIPCECPPRGHFFDCDVYLRQNQKAPKPPEPTAQPQTERKRKKDEIPRTAQLKLDLEPKTHT